MEFVKLRKLAEKYEAGVVSRGGFTRTPPHYFSSLRHGLGAYFNTFHTQNASYEYYARGLSHVKWKRQLREYLDEDNSILAIVSLERFFELFIKDILRKVHKDLIYSSKHGYKDVPELFTRILSGEFIPKSTEGKKHTVPFKETLKRFFGLVDLMDLQHRGIADNMTKKFSVIAKRYSVLTSKSCQGSLELLNWYRDRILHSGNRLPSLWLLDYIISQRLMPLIEEITTVHKKELDSSLFYLKTLTNIDIVKAIRSLSFDFSDLKSKSNEAIFLKLLHLGHLKELGRANMNMNLYMRSNRQASYEYNYRDPMGRGKRFAKAERKEHKHAIDIKACPCCGVESMVVYRERIEDFFSETKKMKNIDWVKCYTCEYHVRYNAGDPFLLQLSQHRVFGKNVKANSD